jgi:hypothetical protein
VSVIKIRQDVPEVKQPRQLAAIIIWLTTTRDAALLKTATYRNMVVIGMTSTMSLKIGGASEQGLQLHRDDL